MIADRIGFGTQVCGDLTAGSEREWLVTDGRGGYAMGTVTGLRTRRYHGLLVVAGDPPARRHLAVAALDPVLRFPSGAMVRLGTHEWASGAVEPRGYAYLESFDLVDGVPRWRWRVGDVMLERELAMVRGRPEVAVVHRLIAGGPVTLALDALVTWRDSHGERTAAGPPPRVEPVAGGVVVEDTYRLAGPGWEPAGGWWHGVHHREEAARGLAPGEDLWHAGRFTAALDGPGAMVEASAWARTSDRDLAQASIAQAPIAEAPITQAPIAGTPAGPAATIAAARARGRRLGTLGRAADQFIVTTAAGHPDVVAGYPWFGAWSRDTMIAYEGLFLATGRAEQGRALLTTYAATLSEGMLANTADTGTVEYNTADGTLWFVHAVARHVAVTGDTDLAASLLPDLDGVIEAHTTGTRYAIRVEAGDGLLHQGVPGEALTWMDARVGGVPVTPRHGAAVEINALWVNALGATAKLHALAGGPGGGLDQGTLESRYAAAREAFARHFPAPGGGLYDTTGSAAVRPNQLFAYSLPYAPLQAEPATVRALGAALLTPLGLRSLAPADPGYLGTHRGDPAGRDRAYHQGTVWPWLIGPYADACRRAGLATAGLVDGLSVHLGEWGLGSVSETADGDPPYRATGCPFQAWSVAELARITELQPDLYTLATRKSPMVTDPAAG